MGINCISVVHRIHSHDKVMDRDTRTCTSPPVAIILHVTRVLFLSLIFPPFPLSPRLLFVITAGSISPAVVRVTGRREEVMEGSYSEGGDISSLAELEAALMHPSA